MTKNNLLRLGTALLFSIILFTSCNDDSKTYEADVDAYVQKYMMDDETVYEFNLFSYGTESVESVIVTPPSGDDDNISLDKLANSTNVYYLADENKTLTSEMPESGTYSFNVSFTDLMNFSGLDIFSDDEIDIPTITDCSWDDSNNSLLVSWETDDNADAYNVSIKNTDNETIFSSVFGSNESSEITIVSTSSGWYQSPVNDMELTVEVNAYLFEDTATNNDWSVNFQCIAIAKSETIWNPSSN